MDVSKLPRLSKTEVAPAPDAAEPAAPATTPQRQPAAERPNDVGSVGAEAWISLAVGAILLFVFPRPIQYAIARMSSPDQVIIKTTSGQSTSGALKSETDTAVQLVDGAGAITEVDKQNIASRERGDPVAFTWNITDSAGNPIRYLQSAMALPDIGVVSFAILMIFDGLVLFFDRRGRLILLAFLLTIAVSGLNLIAIISSYKEGGFQLMCAVAVAIGIYMAMYQWRQIPRRRLAAARP
jgi:hypothetical protein